MAATNGNNILVYKSSTLIAGMKSNDIQVDADLIEISSPATGAWKQYITGRKSCSLTVGYLVMADSALGVSGGNGVRDLLQVGNSFTLHFKSRGAADSAGVSGTFILKTAKITAQRGSLVQGSFQFVLSGALS
jgi:predicted secreted protein